MKNIMRITFAVIFLSVALSGCKKDKDTPNYLKIADTTTSLSWGDIVYYGTGAGWDGYGYQIFLYPNTIIYDEGTDLWSGSGNYIMFELASSLNNGAETGTYTFHLFDVLPELSFDEYSFWTIDWNLASEQYVYLNGGTLSIKNLDNDRYEITFTGTDYAGNTIKAHFKGTLTFYDDSKKSMNTMVKPMQRGGFIQRN